MKYYNLGRLKVDVGGYLKTVTLKLVYKDHPRDQQNVVFIHMWSLYAGSVT